MPALERLLRALHRTEGSNRELCHRSLGGFGLFASHFRSFEPVWAAVFAYGEPREVASLMATSATVCAYTEGQGTGLWWHGQRQSGVRLLLLCSQEAVGRSLASYFLASPALEGCLALFLDIRRRCD